MACAILPVYYVVIALLCISGEAMLVCVGPRVSIPSSAVGLTRPNASLERTIVVRQMPRHHWIKIERRNLSRCLRRVIDVPRSTLSSLLKSWRRRIVRDGCRTRCIIVGLRLRPSPCGASLSAYSHEWFVLLSCGRGCKSCRSICNVCQRQHSDHNFRVWHGTRW